jgi:hypothetical protein
MGRRRNGSAVQARQADSKRTLRTTGYAAVEFRNIEICHGRSILEVVSPNPSHASSVDPLGPSARWVRRPDIASKQSSSTVFPNFEKLLLDLWGARLCGNQLRLDDRVRRAARGT